MIRNPLLKLVIYPLYLVYGLVVRLRNGLYRVGVFRRRRLSVPVVSMGNLTAGGTGKTPCTVALAHALHGVGVKPLTILSRGYGRQSKDLLQVTHADTELYGDEPVLMWKLLRDHATVWVGANRYRTGLQALDSGQQPSLFLLDDGFQHRKLHRDVDIVLLDCTNPFGGNRLIPFGLLREPVAGVGRADVIILTRSRYRKDLEQLTETVRQMNPGAFLTTADTEITGFFEPGSGKVLTPDSLNGTRVLVFSGIGNPLSFKADMITNGAEVDRAIAFRDHSVPSPDRLTNMLGVAKASGAQYIVTTEKDWVKLAAETLPEGFPLLVCQSRMKIAHLDKLVNLIKEKTQHAEGSDCKN